MSVPLTGPGGYFSLIGRLKGILDAVNLAAGSTVPGKVSALVTDLAGVNQADAARLYQSLAGYQQAAGPIAALLQSIASSDTVAQVAADSAQADSNWTTAIAAIVRQMKASGDTVGRCTVGASASAAAGNTGTPVAVASSRTAGGVPTENQFAETVAAVCTNDAYSGTATAGREPFLFRGLQAAPGTAHFSYPAGSGASLTLNCVDASVDAASASTAGNLLANGSFESFAATPNLPDKWHAGAGAPGTQILESTAAHYDGAASLRLAGDGATATSVYQEFGVDTPARLAPSTQYAFCGWARIDTAPAAGALEFALVDGSDAVIADAAGTPNATQVTLATIGATFVPVSGSFRTPKALPASVRIRVRLATPLSAGSSVFVDRVALAQAAEFYPGGPSFAVFSSAAPAAIGDSLAVAVTNDYGGKIQRAADALMPMRQNRLLLPSSATPTIPDSLVT